MKNFFKPEDFHFKFVPATSAPEEAAILANTKLNAEIEKWPTVYANKGHEADWSSFIENTYYDYKARLAFIEPIEKKECEHDIELKFNHETSHSDSIGTFVRVDIACKDFWFECTKCGKKLKAKWEVAE